MENVRKWSTFLNISRVNIYQAKIIRLQNFQGMTLSPERLFETKDSRMDQVKFVEGSLYKFERIWSASFMSDFPVIWQLGKSQEVQWMKTLNIYDLV